MNFKQMLGVLFCALFTFTTTVPIIVCARMLEKKLANGVVQRVFLFGDRHMWLEAHSEDVKKVIHARDAREQAQVITWARLHNALVCIEDLYEDQDHGPFYYWITLLPRLMLKGELSMWGADSYLAHFTEKCRAHNIKMVNIESRHSASAFLSAWGAICVMSWVKYFGRGFFGYGSYQEKIIDVLAQATLATSAYGIWHQYHEISTSVDYSLEKDKLKKHWATIEHAYKFDWLLGGTYAWVDIKALTTIFDNPNQKNIFICAGDAHCYNIEQALVSEGYLEKHRMFDEVALRSYGMWVQIESPFNIDDFMKKCN